MSHTSRSPAGISSSSDFTCCGASAHDYAMDSGCVAVVSRYAHSLLTRCDGYLFHASEVIVGCRGQVWSSCLAKTRTVPCLGAAAPHAV